MLRGAGVRQILHGRKTQVGAGRYRHAVLEIAVPVPPASSAPPASPSGSAAVAAKIEVRELNFYYGARRVLEQIALDIRPNEVTALIGPSGCGKSTFLRSLNRMNDIVPGARVDG